MNIAIIGGGFTGLSAAYELTKCGHTVTLFEKEKQLGGLAVGWKEKGWQWSLEKGYHHWFTNDNSIFGLIRELGLYEKLIIKRPITSIWWNGRMYPFDSPSTLLSFPGLSFLDKIRTALLLSGLKLNPFWKPLESITAEHLFRTIGGTNAYRTIWEPLLYGKFGDYAPEISAAWLWARVKKRTPSLVYMQGGFQTLVDALARAIRKRGGTIKTNSKFKIQNSKFDRTLLTVPTSIAMKLFPEMKRSSVPHLHAQVLILETKEPILKDVYWLNVTDRSFPFLAVVAHTNMIDKKHYGGHHITYIGNYLPDGHKYLSMTADQLCREFLPFINRLSITANGKMKTVNSSKKSLPFTVYRLHSFVGPFAQPVAELHYSQIAPKLNTPVPGVYLANLDSIYPWDRGTNYAVELGVKAARTIHEDS